MTTRPLALSAEERHPWVRALLEDLAGDPEAVDVAIDAGDEMFRYLLGRWHGQRDLALVDYFKTGAVAASTLGCIGRWWLAERPGPAKVLDFAAGWGRVSRFLSRELPGSQIWVSDICGEAVAFQRQRFGLSGFPSASQPEALGCEETFDLILVTSLFTHLPRQTFVPWLRRLLELLAPGGLLVASVHDQAVLPQGWSMPPEGHLYEAASEIESLDAAEYGGAWVSEGFVRRALAEARGGEGPYRRLPRGLWHFQDLYLVPREPDRDLAALELPRGPEGYVVAGRQEADGRLLLSGWAVDHEAPGEPPGVRLTVDGRAAAEVPAAEPRPEVAASLGDGRFLASGWSLALGPPEAPPPAPTAELRLEAVGRGGVRYLLHLGTVEGLAAHLASCRADLELAEARRELQRADRLVREHVGLVRDLRAHLDALEASRFWKLRNAWLRLKGLLRG